MAPDRPRHPFLLALVLGVITAGVAVALATSSPSGTGAANVGDAGADPLPAEPAPETTAREEPARPRRCRPTRSNPGGTNNYIPDAPEVRSLGSGFVVTGRVRAARGCAPLAGIPVQVWLATATGSEQDNRATVRTGRDGVYRIATAPTIAQFGEPNIHVGYGGGEYGEVFIRRVVDLDDKRAVVDLTLARGEG